MSKFKQFWIEIGRWMRRHPRWTIALIGLALIISAGITAYNVLSQPMPELPKVEIPAKVEVPEPPKYYSPLTGLEVKSEAATKKPVTAIMIENSPDARPQSGLKNSGVVYEAIAEGGITRFLVLYQQEKPKLVGPVRSLRMYYVDWLAPYNASVAHVGGSYKALKEIRNGNYRDIDQFFNPQYYWRATDRWAPHNVYTNFSKLDALNKAKGYKESSPKPFARADSKKAEKITAKSIDVTISSALYNSHYNYDAKTNTYKRFQAGAPHNDREGGQIHPRVVVVMKLPMTLVFEDGYRQQYGTSGKGTAYIFQDGTVREVIWNKANRSSQIKFTNSKGKEIPLARGQTWITAIPKSTGDVTWK